MTDKADRIVAARMKLRARYLAASQGTPSIADRQPQGAGPKNRHGMPQLPPGQVETDKWPVLDLGIQPEVPTSSWRLTVDGACDNPFTLTWADFMGLEQTDDVSDFHCVTTWSRMDIPWRGVRLAELIAHAVPHDDVAHVLFHAYDDYTTNISLDEAVKPDVLVVHTADGKPLERAHGGPARVITPQLYAWKGAKWVKRIELLVRDQRGFWEERGYSNTAYPWRDDRYS